MKFTRVRTEYGSHIEPPLDQGWGELTKLQWHAGVVAVDAAIDEPSVEVSNYSIRTFGIWVRQRGYYDVAGCGPLNFNDAWSYLNGMVAGAQAKGRANEHAT